MKATFILPCYASTPVGGFRVVYEYANHLVSRGHEVTIIHKRPDGGGEGLGPYRRMRRKAVALRDWLLKPSVVVGWQRLDPRVRMLMAPNLNDRFIPDADAVFATHWPTARAVLGYPPRKGVKFYLVQDFYPWFAAREALEETWAWPLNKVCVSTWLYQMVCASPSVGGSAAAIPNGIDGNRFCLKNDISTRPRQIAIMCSLTTYKTMGDGLKALEEVVSIHPQTRIVGFGPQELDGHGLPQWLDLSWNISEPDLVDLYNSSSIFVCSSAAEGFALPAAEAMACGCAVVSTDCGGNSDYAEDGVTALLSPPRAPEALARNVLRLLRDDDLRAKIAIEGHRRIQAFTWRRSASLLEEYMKKCVEVPSGAAGEKQMGRWPWPRRVKT